MAYATTKSDNTPDIDPVRYDPVSLGEPHFEKLVPYDLIDPKHPLAVDRIVSVHRLRTFVDSLPETKTLFKMSAFMSETGLDSSAVTEATHNIVGSWRAPGRFGNGKLDRYVNPHAPDAWMHTPVGRFCECGAIVLSAEKHETKTNHLPVRVAEHTDECNIVMRTRTIADVMEARHEELEVALKYWQKSGARVGTKDSRLTRTAQSHGFDVEEARTLYRKRLAHTAAAWMHKYPTTDLSEAFGLPGRSLRKYIRQYTPVDGNEMYRYRTEVYPESDEADRPYPFPAASGHPPRRWFDEPHKVEFND